jgi:2-desacetyl-2-hydroxyethyl bacteriochlorophyllide A dehydrogenase
MRALQLVEPKLAELVEVPTPTPAADQVLVRLEGCGLCGSNLSPWQGRPWFRYPFDPGAPGHEGWGRVAALGSSVSDVRIGDRVALLSERAFAEYDVAPADAIVRLPEALDEQVVPGEALACAVNVFRRSDIHGGHDVAIVGLGFIGALLAQMAARVGARVFAISRRSCALELGRRMGASEALTLTQPDEQLLAQVAAWTNGALCDRTIEAAGHQRTLDLAAKLTRTRGRMIVAGYHQDGARQIDMQLWNWRGLDVINAHERDRAVYVEGMRAAVEAIAAGRLDPTPLYTHSVALDDAAQAFTALDERPHGFMKAQVLTR